MRKGSLFAVIAAAAAFFLVAQAASAQYPPPKTSLVCAVNQIEVKTGSTTALTAALRDIGGAPLGGYMVKFRVVSGDATLSTTSAATDGSGTAVVTVRFGASAGTVVIRGTSESSQCQASTNVAGIVPPNTGSAGLAGSGATNVTLAGPGLGTFVLAAGVMALRRPTTA